MPEAGAHNVLMFFSQFIMTAVAVALPIPAGIFFPVFLIGKEALCVHTWGMTTPRKEGEREDRRAEREEDGLRKKGENGKDE